ncbi:hypothetical protein ACCS96_04925, partial [Rhizobium ruizarguesonis]
MEASATPEMDTLEARQYIVIRYKSMGESMKAKMSHGMLHLTGCRVPIYSRYRQCGSEVSVVANP